MKFETRLNSRSLQQAPWVFKALLVASGAVIAPAVTAMAVPATQDQMQLSVSIQQANRQGLYLDVNATNISKRKTYTGMPWYYPIGHYSVFLTLAPRGEASDFEKRVAATELFFPAFPGRKNYPTWTPKLSTWDLHQVVFHAYVTCPSPYLEQHCVPLERSKQHDYDVVMWRNADDLSPSNMIARTHVNITDAQWQHMFGTASSK